MTHSTSTARNASYTYDSQGQLTKEVNTKGTYNYTYDTYGNIRSVGGAESHTYTYGDSEWLDLLTAYDGKSITYDAIGNPAVWHNSSGDWELSWSNGRQLMEAKKGSHFISYTNDLAGIRDSKTVDGVTYNYLTQNGQVVRQTWGNHVMDFVYDNTGKPYALKYDGTTYYYVLNLQGDVISIITHWGESYGSYTYDAWGNVIAQSGSIASINPIRYRGYYYDSETGLYYLGSRYYDPVVKRFINADGAAFATINPYSNGLTDKNYFAYCDNNPVSRSDDGGELFLEIAGSALLGGVCGMFSAAASGQNLAAGFVVGAATSAASSYLRVGTAVADAVISGIGEIYEQKANNPTGKIDWKSVAKSAAIGGVSSLIGAKSVSKLAKAIGSSRVAKGVVKTVTSAFTTTATISGQAIYRGLRNSRENRKLKKRQQQRNNRAGAVRDRYRRQYGR